MGRQLQILWKETPEVLMRLWKEEKDIHIRDRLWALWQIQIGRKTADVASCLGISYRTLLRWIRWYRKGGLMEVKRHKQGKGGGRRPFLTQEQQGQLYEESKKGHFRRVLDAVEWVERKWGIHYSEDGMRLLMHRLGLRWKIPRPVNPKASPEQQEAWKGGD